MIVCLNGQFVSEKEAKVSVFDHGFLYGDGIYETLRTYKGKVFQLDRHLERLRHSAEVLKIVLPWDKGQIAEWIQKTIEQNGHKESRVRVTVTRGLSISLGAEFDPSTVSETTICIAAYHLNSWTPDEPLSEVKTVTFDGERVYPEVKSLNMLTNVMARFKAKEYDAYDALLVNRDGEVTEGAGTNFFLVKNGKLIAPDKNILMGTTRKVVLDLAKDIVEVALRNVKKEEVYGAEELFLTNALKGMLLVSHVDGKMIGDGSGKVTKIFYEKFKEFILKSVGEV